MLKAEGLVINVKRTYRIYNEENLQVRRKRRKRLASRDRVPMPVPDGVNQRWSMTLFPIKLRPDDGFES
jgi:putative transposase